MRSDILQVHSSVELVRQCWYQCWGFALPSCIELRGIQHVFVVIVCLFACRQISSDSVGPVITKTGTQVSYTSARITQLLKLT